MNKIRFLSLLDLQRIEKNRINMVDLKRHEFFHNLNWDDVIQLKLNPPIVLTALKLEGGIQKVINDNFLELDKESFITEEEQSYFAGFEYTNPDFANDDNNRIKVI